MMNLKELRKLDKDDILEMMGLQSRTSTGAWLAGTLGTFGVGLLVGAGLGLLLMGSFKKLAAAPWGDIAVVSVTAMVGIAALAAGVQNWLFKRTTVLERWLLIAAGLALVYPKPMLDYIGGALIVIAIVLQKMRKEPVHAAA